MLLKKEHVVEFFKILKNLFQSKDILKDLWHIENEL